MVSLRPRRSLWPLSPALGWMSCEGSGHQGPPRVQDLAGETATSQGEISRIHLGRSHELLFPPGGRAPGGEDAAPPGRAFKKLSHLETLSLGTLDSAPGVGWRRGNWLGAKFIVLFPESGRSLHFWEPYGSIHGEREAISGSPIKSTLKLSSKKILSALLSIFVILRKKSCLVWSMSCVVWCVYKSRQLKSRIYGEKKTCKVTKILIFYKKTRHTSCHITIYVSYVTLLVKVFSKTADMWEDEINHDDEVVSVKSRL